MDTLLALVTGRHGILLFVMGLFFVGCENDRPVSFSTIQAPVVFISNPDAGNVASLSGQELMLLDVATGRSWRLTSDWASDRQPTWSPSGSHVMFISDRDPDGSSMIPPWATGTGIDRLYTLDLKNGEIHHIDLSWAYDSGLAKARVPEGDMRTLSWLDCAAWSPVDSSQIAVGVTVKGAYWEGNPETSKMRPSDHRIVLLDLHTRESHLLAEPSKHCSSLDWSPDGRYLSVNGPNDFEYIDVKTRRTFSAVPYNLPNNEPVQFVHTDWINDNNKLKSLVMYVDFNSNIYYSYEYNVKTRKASEIGAFQDSVTTAQYAPRTTKDGNRNLILRQWSRDDFYEDLYLYHTTEQSFVRLTHDQTPKKDIRSYIK